MIKISHILLQQVSMYQMVLSFQYLIHQMLDVKIMNIFAIGMTIGKMYL